MSVPFTLTGIPFTLALVASKAEVPHGTGEKFPAVGEINWDQHSLRVAGNLTRVEVNQNLLHELLHGVVRFYHVRELVRHGDPSDHSEPALDQLAAGLQEVLGCLGVDLVAAIEAKERCALTVTAKPAPVPYP
jgi:hypothetical protein